MPKKKNTTKKAVAKKFTAKEVKTKTPKNAHKIFPQKGESNGLYDAHFQASKPGWRKSKTSGKWYFENRTNRSDEGKLLGIGRADNLIRTNLKKEGTQVSFALMDYDFMLNQIILFPKAYDFSTVELKRIKAVKKTVTDTYKKIRQLEKLFNKFEK